MTAAASLRSRATSPTALRIMVVAMMAIPVIGLGVPSEVPFESRVLASILWVLCLVPAWHYLRLPEGRRPPIPFLPLIGAVYLFYYPLHIVLGQSSVNYLFRLDPAFDYDRAVQYALAGWVALLIGYYGGAPLRLNSPFRAVRPTDLGTLRTWGKLLVWGGFLIDAARHPALAEMAKEFHGATAMALHGLMSLPFFLALAGVVLAYVFYLVKPEIPAAIKSRFSFLYRILDNKYYMDWFNENVLARAARATGRGLWKGGDVGLIDGVVIHGSARAVNGFASAMRLVQTGYLYWYALVMILGVLGLMTWQLWPTLQAALRGI